MGVNNDSNAAQSTGEQKVVPDKKTFRLKVVEHLSWDTYDENSRTFKLGHEDNKPIGGRKFKIKMPDGRIVEKATDENGIIELTDQEANAKFEVIFEPEEAALNNKYNLFYNRTAVVKTKLPEDNP